MVATAAGRVPGAVGVGYLPGMIWSLVLPLALAEPEMIPASEMELVGHPAPPIEAKLADGTSFTLASKHGKTVVVSFWASWCGPCRNELPALSTFAKEHPQFEYVALNVDRDREAAAKFLASVKVELPVAYDPEAISMGAYGVMSMPTMFVVDGKGTLAWQKVGFSQERGLSELAATLGVAK